MTDSTAAYRSRMKYDEKTTRSYQRVKESKHRAEMRLVDRAFGSIPKTHRVLDIPCSGIYANANLGERVDGNWQGFPVVFRSLKFYEDIGRKNNLRVVDLGKQGSFIKSDVRAMDEKTS